MELGLPASLARTDTLGDLHGGTSAVEAERHPAGHHALRKALELVSGELRQLGINIKFHRQTFVRIAQCSAIVLTVP